MSVLKWKHKDSSQNYILVVLALYTVINSMAQQMVWDSAWVDRTLMVFLQFMKSQDGFQSCHLNEDMTTFASW